MFAVMLDQTPQFSTDDARRFARQHFDVDGRATPLSSERDQNFLIESGDGRRIVLKIANATESCGVLEAQRAAMQHLARTVSTVPGALRTVGGEPMRSVESTNGRSHLL